MPFVPICRACPPPCPLLPGPCSLDPALCTHAHPRLAGSSSFSAQDYMLPTPAWAAFGSAEAGFDPGQQRVKKVRNHPGKGDAASSTAAEELF